MSQDANAGNPCSLGFQVSRDLRSVDVPAFCPALVLHLSTSGHTWAGPDTIQDVRDQSSDGSRRTLEGLNAQPPTTQLPHDWRGGMDPEATGHRCRQCAYLPLLASQTTARVIAARIKCHPVVRRRMATLEEDGRAPSTPRSVVSPCMSSQSRRQSIVYIKTPDLCPSEGGADRFDIAHDSAFIGVYCASRNNRSDNHTINISLSTGESSDCKGLRGILMCYLPLDQAKNDI